MKIVEHKGGNFNGFTIWTAPSLEEIYRKIEEILNDPKISLVVHSTLALPEGATRSYYKNTPIAIRFWEVLRFETGSIEPRYDTALKSIKLRTKK